MEKINFENGTLVSPAKVTIDGTDYIVTPAERTGNTPISAHVLNQLQEKIEKSTVAVSSTEPSTNEKVWIKKGKNLIDTSQIEVEMYDYDDSGNKISDTSNCIGIGKIQVEPNTEYTFSAEFDYTKYKTMRTVTFDKNGKFLMRSNILQLNQDKSKNFRATGSTHYVTILL